MAGAEGRCLQTVVLTVCRGHHIEAWSRPVEVRRRGVEGSRRRGVEASRRRGVLYTNGASSHSTQCRGVEATVSRRRGHVYRL